MKKSNNLYNQGYIYAPYIIVNKPAIIVGDSKEWIRRMEIRKRNEKIQKIKNIING
jgi:hypothetical protein